MPFAFWQRTIRFASPINRRRVRSARATLLFGLIFLLIAIAGIAFALETSKPQWRDPEFGHRIARLHKIQQQNPSCSIVLVLGTSRTQNAIRPAAMGFLDEDNTIQMFNFGQSGASPLKILLTLMRILDEGIRPAAVLVEVLPVWLTFDGAAEDQFQNDVPQLSVIDLQHLAPYCHNPDELRSRWLAARTSPWHTQRISLMSHWLPNWMPWQSRINFQWQTMEPDGFVPFLFTDPPLAFRTEATAKTRQQYAGSFGGFRPGAMSLRALSDLVARCRTANVPVAFFVPPVAPTFQSWFDPGAWRAGESDLLAVSKELGVDVFQPPNQFADVDFADGHHMLRKSAERYSRWLADTHLHTWCKRNRIMLSGFAK